MYNVIYNEPIVLFFILQNRVLDIFRKGDTLINNKLIKLNCKMINTLFLFLCK